MLCFEFYYRYCNGELNASYNCADLHVKNGLGDEYAIIHDSPLTNTVEKITYKKLMEEVALFAGVLSEQGVKKGDRVLIYMPMIPQAIIAMLASVRLGAIHSLVFGGFASKELSTRINHAKPKVIVSANAGYFFSTILLWLKTSILTNEITDRINNRNSNFFYKMGVFKVNINNEKIIFFFQNVITFDVIYSIEF